MACLRLADVPMESVVHGASAWLHTSTPRKATITTHAEVTAIYDLKRFAQVVVSTDSVLPSGELLGKPNGRSSSEALAALELAAAKSDDGAVPQTPRHGLTNSAPHPSKL